MKKKYYYCPKCKKAPNKIIERYHSIDELREWDGELYELISSSLEEPESVHCAECDTELDEIVDKEQ